MTPGARNKAAPAALGEDNGYCFHREPGAGTASPTTKRERLKMAKQLVPEFERFQLCNDAAAPRAQLVSIYRKGQNSWFGGVIRCNSVWLCPVCAPQIAAGRRDELQEAIDTTVRKDCGVMLVTLTFPHGAGDVLADILERFGKAQRYFKSGRAAAALRDRIGFIGEVRTLEVTHGLNGWHPHAHSLWFTSQKLSQEQIDELSGELYQAWLRACLKAGLPEPSRAHGVDIRNARYAGEYVAKWGFATELALHTNKRGKKESAGKTPWELLEAATAGDQRAGWLWREFALAFRGKRQLFWSRGLRERLSLAEERSDEQLLLELDRRAEQVAVLDLDTWYVIRRARAQEYVLHLAVHDLDRLHGFLNELRSSVPMEHGRPPGPREDWDY